MYSNMTKYQGKVAQNKSSSPRPTKPICLWKTEKKYCEHIVSVFILSCVMPWRTSQCGIRLSPKAHPKFSSPMAFSAVFSHDLHHRRENTSNHPQPRLSPLSYGPHFMFVPSCDNFCFHGEEGRKTTKVLSAYFM